MACMGGKGCGGTTIAPKKPQLTAAAIRPTSVNIGKITFGKPKINRSR